MLDDDDDDAPGLTATGLLGHPAVDRARAAHHLVRTVGHQPERFARMRDEAVAAALRDGVSVQRVAQALDVLPADVQRMSRDHGLRTPAAGRAVLEGQRAETGGS